MSKHTIFLTVVLFLLLAACAPTQTETLEEESAAFDYAQAADSLAYRWTAMGKAYERMGLLNDGMDPGDLSAYRWQAMGKAYERMGLLNDQMDPGDLSAYRWQAMGRAYKRMGLLNDGR